ncbi:MAG: Glyoxalase-like domain protein [candidate division WS6 bacterium OLB20]|uniref:Glyoxalase-like domain protein n=1 Tax=candidate division WS6 bacterium OLB20 TaxID=1617426 RepID=A0A136LWY3_9BACT|nr:MAG: Glyoxalase-like domain protein [candidate division WS6 bacterium OLB20]
MQLGAFSLSLSVKDIHKSKEFYEKLGFTEAGGHIGQNWIMMRNGDCLIGLFQDMFEGNILTFTPGWDSSAKELDSYTDVRELQKQLKEKGIELTETVDEDGSGPGHFYAYRSRRKRNPC